MAQRYGCDMDQGDTQIRQGHHRLSQGQGQVPTGFDTFVMTGDMIIKTTPKLKAPPLSSPKPRGSAPECGDAVLSEKSLGDLRLTFSSTGLSSCDRSSPDGHPTSVNGGPETESTPPVASGNVVGGPQFSDLPPPELDVPPDDISSDDERFRADFGDDLDVTKLPPPPEEFLDLAYPCPSTSLLPDGAPRWDGAFPDGSGDPADWRNSLDEAIMRLERLPAETFSDRRGDTCTGGLDVKTALSAGKAGSSGNLVPVGPGVVRGSKSQDNWRTGDGGLGLVCIDVDGPSTSVDALNHELSSRPCPESHDMRTCEFGFADQLDDEIWRLDPAVSGTYGFICCFICLFTE